MLSIGSKYAGWQLNSAPVRVRRTTVRALARHVEQKELTNFDDMPNYTEVAVCCVANADVGPLPRRLLADEVMEGLCKAALLTAVDPTTECKKATLSPGCSIL